MEPRRTTNRCTVANVDVFYRVDRANGRAAANGTPVTALVSGVRLGNFGEPFDKRRMEAVEARKVGKLRGQFIKKNDLTTASFIQHVNRHTIAEHRAGIRGQGTDVLDAGVGPNIVVGQMNANIRNAYIRAKAAIDDCCVGQTGRLFNSARFYNSSLATDLNLANKINSIDAGRIKIILNLHGVPIRGRATVADQSVAFFAC
jgi:hypothetical protein